MQKDYTGFYIKVKIIRSPNESLPNRMELIGTELEMLLVNIVSVLSVWDVVRGRVRDPTQDHFCWGFPQVW